MAGRAPLAGQLRLSVLRLEAQLEAGDQGVDVGMHRLRPLNIGDRRHNHAQAYLRDGPGKMTELFINFCGERRQVLERTS